MATDIVTLLARRADAEAKYHDLVTGVAVRVVVDQSGERIEYQIAGAARLLAYIHDLTRQIEIARGAKPRGPMRFRF